MTENLNLQHERVDDVPLLIGLMKRLGWPEVLDRHLGNHGHHQGLSNGWLVVGWLAYILSQGDHRKSRVQEWAEHLADTLASLLEQPIRPGVEFDDDRLGIVLQRLSQTAAWEALEADLWQSCLAVYAIEVRSVRLDGTTSYGYHTPQPAGLMQRGYSKDHRPDLPQLKLMAAAAEPAGHLLACDIHPGQRNDDELYLPLIARVRPLLGRRGMLYVGDCKMAALPTRAGIVAQDDYYLTILPHAGEAAPYIDGWIAAAANGAQPTQPIYAGERLLADGYEFLRPLQAEVAGQPITWHERVQVVRSVELAQQMQADLARRVAEAEAALHTLAPGVGRGKRQYHDEAALSAAVEALLQRYRVAGLLR
jgi:transposase